MRKADREPEGQWKDKRRGIGKRVEEADIKDKRD